MSRIAAVVLLCIALLAALWSVRDFDPRSQPSDEILAYEIGAQTSVSVSVPGGVDRVLITTWLTVPIGASDEQHLYGIDTQLFRFDGKGIGERSFATRTRVSDVADGASVPSARLADASAGVCEPRSFELVVDALGGKAGILRVSLAADAAVDASVLLRLTHAVERGDIERRIVERALSPREIERIMARRSSLGFFDIPEQRRTAALSTWERRLTAQGRVGRDYFTRRLLLGGPEEVALREPWRYDGYPTSPSLRLALNLRGAATLRVSAEPRTVVVLRDAEEVAPTRHVVPDEGYVDLSLPERPLRSLELYTEVRSQVALSSPRGEAWAWVTARAPRVIADRYEVVPDFRRQSFYRLHREKPVVMEMAESQQSVALSVRALLEDEDAGEQQVAVVATWRDEEGEPVSTARHSVLLVPSSFEMAREQRVTDHSVTRLLVPERAVRLEIYGSENTLVAPFVAEPGVIEPKALAPYDQEPAEDLAWRNEPWEVAPVAALAPDNVEALRRSERLVQVTRQVRLEPLEGIGSPLAPRVLEPVGSVTKRWLFRPEAVAPGAAYPRNAWTWLTRGQEQRLRVPDHGSVPYIYLAEPAALGGRWSLRTDGREALLEPVVVTDGQGVVELLPGVAEFSFTGLGLGGVLLLKTPPAAPATVVKRQSVYQLVPGRTLSFPFQRREGELVSVAVFVVGLPEGAEAEDSLPVLRHVIDRGHVATHQAFFRRMTEATGEHAVQGPSVGRGFVWTPQKRKRVTPDADAVHRVIVRLGDDLAPGRHSFQVSMPRQTRAPVWIRAVLVGTLLDSSAGVEER